ncbi:MAG: hypothetical protein IPI49_26720 [Myxococcales bacterium]|nr:hypothetical protein [Myxococcales bacterium]
MLARASLGWLALIAALAVAGAPPAWAQPAPARRVLVLPFAAPAPFGGESAADIERAAGELADPRIEVVGDGVALARRARLAGAVPATTLAEMDAVTSAGVEGWRAYLQVAVPFAASRLAKARSDAESLLPVPGGLELYADLSLRLGAVLLALGRAQEAEEALALALALDPQREVSLLEFSPDIVEAAARVSQRAGEPQTLTVITPGLRGVRLEIDGRFAGVTEPQGGGAPALVLSLPRGQHVVVARRTGYEPQAQALRLHAASELRLALREAPLDQALARAAVGMPEELALALIEGTVTYADADEALLVATTTRRGAPALLAQRCDDRARCTAVVEVGYVRPGLSAALRAAWSALARGELRYPPSLPGDSRLQPSPTTAGDGKCRLCRNPWLWAGVGTALVASAALIVVLAQDDPVPILVVDPDTFGR